MLCFSFMLCWVLLCYVILCYAVLWRDSTEATRATFSMRPCGLQQLATRKTCCMRQDFACCRVCGILPATGEQAATLGNRQNLVKCVTFYALPAFACHKVICYVLPVLNWLKLPWPWGQCSNAPCCHGGTASVPRWNLTLML